MRNTNSTAARPWAAPAMTMMLWAALAAVTPAAAQGSLIWEDQVDGLEGFDDEAEAVAAKGKFVIVAGHTTVPGIIMGEGDGQNLAWLVRGYDARNGTLLWEDIFDFGSFDDEAKAIALQGKTVVVGGRVTASDEVPLEGVIINHSDWYVRAYDVRDGTLLWQDQVGGTGFDEVRGMGIKGRDVYIAGNVTPFEESTGQDWLVRAHDIRDGALLWQSQFGGEGGGFDNVEDTPLPIIGRRLVVVGDTQTFEEGGDSDWLVRVLDRRDGSLIWQDQVNGSANAFDDADDAGARGGKVFVAGSVSDAFGGEGINEDGLVRAYRARNGDLLWEQQIDRSGGNFDDLDELVVQGGRVVVGGEFDNFPLILEGDPFRDGLLQAYRAGNGQLIWEDVFDQGANDDVDAMIVQRGVVLTVGEVNSFAEGEEDQDWHVHAVRVKNGDLVFDRLVDENGDDDTVEDGFALAAAGRRLFVVGEVDNGKDDDWLVQALDLKN